MMDHPQWDDEETVLDERFRRASPADRGGDWYLAVDGNIRGPFSSQLARAVARAVTSSEAVLAWHSGLDTWRPVSELRELSSEVSVEPEETVPPVAATDTLDLEGAELRASAGRKRTWGAIVMALGAGLALSYVLLGQGRGPGDATAGPAPGEGAPQQVVRVSARGGLADREVADAVRTQTSRLVPECWVHARATRAPTAPPAARVVLAFEVRETGLVEAISVAEHPVGYDGLASCVQRRARGWVFPVNAQRSQIRVAISFDAH